MIAFANGAGGEIFIGVSDKNREITGIENPLEIEEKISNITYDSIAPIISPYISIIDIEGKKIINIQILPGSNKPYFMKTAGIKKGTFIRIGSSNRKASPEIIEELRRQSRGYSFEEEIIPSLSVSALEQSAIDSFFRAVGEFDTDKDLLSKWSILKRNNGDYFPTIFSIVLFGSAHLANYDHFSIRMTRYNGKDYSDIAESKEFSITLLINIDQIITLLKSYIRKTSILEGVRRLETTVIPEFALREVIINAIVHRDYSIRFSIKVNIFDDRIEVINPGILFGNLDIADIGKGISESRNRKMVKIFRKLGYMEELGTGIKRIMDLYNQQNLLSPIFQEQGQYFKAILPQEYQKSTPADNLLSYMTMKPEVQIQDLVEKTGLHKNTILYHLRALIAQEKIDRKGKGRNTKYLIRTK